MSMRSSFVVFLSIIITGKNNEKMFRTQSVTQPSYAIGAQQDRN